MLTCSDRFVTGYTGAGSPEIIARVATLAGKKNVSMAQIAIAWTLSKDHVTAPIVGTTRLENLQDIIGRLLSISWSRIGLIGRYRCVGR